MRRGIVDKKLFLLIFAVGIATIMSYLFDQLAIRTEDKIRNTEIKRNNHINNIDKHDAIWAYFVNTESSLALSFKSLILNRNFNIKNLIMMAAENSKKYNELKLSPSKDFYKLNIRNYNTLFEIDATSRPREVIEYQLILEISEILSIVEDVRKNYNYFYQNNLDVIKKINNNKIKNLDLFSFNKYVPVNYNDPEWKRYNFEKTRSFFFGDKTKVNIQQALANYSIRDWYNVHRFKMHILKKIDHDLDILDQFSNITSEYNEVLDDELYDIFNSLKEQTGHKNLMILLSIISQILSLLFLLFLFRGFIKK